MARASPHAESSCSPDRKASLLVLGALLSIIGCAPPGEGESALSPGDHAPNHEVDSAPQRIDESPLVALTPTELNNTYRDLLGFPSSPEAWPDPPEIAKAFSASENEVLGVFGNAAIRPKVWPWVFLTRRVSRVSRCWRETATLPPWACRTSACSSAWPGRWDCTPIMWASSTSKVRQDTSSAAANPSTN